MQNDKIRVGSEIKLQASRVISERTELKTLKEKNLPGLGDLT